MNKDKYAIIQWVVTQEDPEVIKAAFSSLERLDVKVKSEKKIIGSRTNGTPISEAAFLDCIQTSQHHVMQGEFSSFEDLELESENW